MAKKKVKKVNSKICKDCARNKPGIHVLGKTSTLLVILLLFSMVFMGFTFAKALFFYNYKAAVYEEKASQYKHDSVAKTIADSCADRTVADEQANCVVDQITAVFSVDMHTFGIKTPTDTVYEGGVCRDWSVTYAVIFNDLGWKTSFVTMPSHVFVSIYKDNTYCNVDQRQITCYQLG